MSYYHVFLLLFASRQEALSRLKRQMAHKWEFIVMQAEEQVVHLIYSSNISLDLIRSKY